MNRICSCYNKMLIFTTQMLKYIIAKNNMVLLQLVFILIKKNIVFYMSTVYVVHHITDTIVLTIYEFFGYTGFNQLYTLLNLHSSTNYKYTSNTNSITYTVNMYK